MDNLSLGNEMWKVQIGVEGVETGGEVLPVTVTYTGHGTEQEETWSGFLISREGIASLEASLEHREWLTLRKQGTHYQLKEGK